MAVPNKLTEIYYKLDLNDYEEIKRRISVQEALFQFYHIKVKNNHCNCPFRKNSNSNSFRISKSGESWTDHNPKGNYPAYGSVIDLVAWMDFNGDIKQSAEFLGKHLGIGRSIQAPVTKEKKKSRLDFLIQSGYIVRKTYDYKTKDGEILHQVIRLEKANCKNEYIQQFNTKEHFTTLYLYDVWHNKKQICIAEGEKDADTLMSLGFHATTNASGCGKWEQSYSELLKNKNVIIFEDNDRAGRSRTAMLLWKLKDYTKTLKVISFSDMPVKSDVTDFVETGKTKNDINELIINSKYINKDKITKEISEWESLQKARDLNRYEFKNYFTSEIADEKGNIKKVSKPLKPQFLYQNLKDRFLGFPYRLGGSLFDHDRDTKKIRLIDSHEKLFAWIMSKSKQNVDWKSGSNMISKKEFYEYVLGETKGFSGLSDTPTFPQREDIYYSHEKLPDPEQFHFYFNKLISFFNPVSEADKIMMATLFCMPSVYDKSEKRPLWIISAESSQSGKTTLAEMVALLYGEDKKIDINLRTLREVEDLNKRLLSFLGRKKKIVLFDNLRGKITSDILAQMITTNSISGRPAYGHQEETRPNDLTYIITSNFAQLDDDIVIRALFIKLKKIEKFSRDWMQNVYGFITKYRYHILADMMDILRKHTPFPDVDPYTRFPEIEFNVMQAFCDNVSQYKYLMEYMNEVKELSNIEDEWVKMTEDFFREKLFECHCSPDSISTWIHSAVARKWTKQVLFDELGAKSYARLFEGCKKYAVNLSTQWVKYPTTREYKTRYRGIAWLCNGVKSDDRPSRIIRFDMNENIIVTDLHGNAT